MKCLTCQFDNPPGSRFCGNCGTSLERMSERVCPECGSSVPAGVKFCLECGARLPDDSAKAVRKEATKPAVTGERKPVTIFFADIVGSTEKAEALDPEEWREVVAGAHERVGAAVGRYEGTVAQLLGDGVLAFFGAPVTHEDDPERSVRAALDLQGSIKDYAEELAGYVDGFAMRVGIHAGTVVVGEIGSEEKSEYLAVGDAVNVAARLEGVAEPGQVIVSDEIARRIRSVFELGGLGPIELKGKSEPIVAHFVIGEKEVHGRARGFQPTERVFVGRQRELQELQQSLLDLCRGHGQICFILGEAGIGKSRLVEELRAHLPEAGPGETLLVDPGKLRWLEGRALSYGGNLSYWLITQVILSDLGLTDGAPPPKVRAALRRRMRELFGEDMDDHQQYVSRLLGVKSGPSEGERLPALDNESMSKELKRSVAAYFERAANQAPLILVLEDLHWADSSSLETIPQLLSLADRVPLMVLGLMRVERDHASWELRFRAETDYGHRYTELNLEPLRGEDAQRLLAKVLGEGGDRGEVASLVLDRAEGNPFYLEELLRHLIEGQLVVRENGSWRITAELARVGVPETLRGVLLARIDRLEEEVQETLQLASVIGRTFLYQILAAISEAERKLDEHLSLLQRVDLVREKERVPELEYMFKHALTQEAAYSSLLLERRRKFHRLVGEAVERLFADRMEEFYGLLAYHYSQAGDVRLGLKYSRAAAEQSLELFDLDSALQLFRRAEDLARQLQDDAVLAEILASKAETLANKGQAHQAIEACEEALQLVKDDDRRTELQVDLASYFITASDPRARPTLETALEGMSESTDPNLRAHALTLMGRDLHYRGKHARALEYFQQALSIAEVEGDPAVSGVIYAYLAGAYQQLGDMQASREAARASMRLGEKYANPLGIAVGHEFLAEAAMHTGEWSKVLVHAGEDERIGAEIGSLDRVAWARYCISEAYFGMGDLDKAYDRGADSLQVSTGIGEHRLATLIEAHLAMIQADRGNFEEAHRLAAQAMKRADGFGQHLLLVSARRGLAVVYIREGEFEKALRPLQEATQMSEESDSMKGVLYVAPHRALVFAELRRWDDMRAELVKFARQLEVAPKLNVARPAYKRLEGRWLMAQESMGEAEDALQESLKWAEDLGSRPERARTLVILAELHQQSGRADQALGALGKALEIMTECGMVPEAEAVREKLETKRANQ